MAIFALKIELCIGVSEIDRSKYKNMLRSSLLRFPHTASMPAAVIGFHHACKLFKDLINGAMLWQGKEHVAVSLWLF